MTAEPIAGVRPDPSDLKAEIRWQFDLVWRERTVRLPLTTFGFALTTIYLPVWIAVMAAAVSLVAEFYSMAIMRDLDPARDRLHYRLAMFCLFVMEFCFSGCAALIWQLNADHAAPFAIGLVMIALLHLASIRAIHLPFGLAGLAGVALPVLFGNAVRWVMLNDALGLVLSTVCALAGLSYALSAMVMTNRLYREAASGRAAAQAGFEAKNRFLAQMSHELRTPLNAILGMGHAELRRSRDAVSQERLSVLISSAEGLSTILDDVLDMAAMQGGRLAIRPRTAVPLDEISAAMALFRPGIEEAGLALHTVFDPSLGNPFQFDTQRLRQCLSNLLSNALKNTPSGSISVTASVQSNSGADPSLRIAIRDTGPGIPPALRETIFEPFNHDRTADHRRIGTSPGSNGLGLSICKALAQQMGGDLVLPDSQGTEDTAAGGGACFVLTLRLQPAIKSTSAELETARATGAESSVIGLTVLVVDDIATNRLVAITYLRMLGATAIVAESGDDALKLLGKDPPDLVLLDMNMPGMDGSETLRRIREMPGKAGRSPVIAMTADANEDLLRCYGDLGLDGYLAKPINPDRMETEMRAALDRRNRRDAG